MKRINLFGVLFALVFCLHSCDSVYAITKTPAKDIETNTTSFNIILNSSDTDVQKALNKINGIDASGTLLRRTGTIFSVKAGTLNEGRGCIYTLANGLVCDSPVFFDYSVLTKTSAYTMTAGDDMVLGDTTLSAFAITLPTAVGAIKPHTVKRIGTGSNYLTVATTGGQTIDGDSTAVLTLTNTSITVASDGSNWRIQ